MHINFITWPFLKLLKVIHTFSLVLRVNNMQISSKVFPFQLQQLDDAKRKKKG